MPAVGSLLTAVETNTRSPHTTGLDTATPATGAFHATFSPVCTSHFTGVGDPSATPDAPGPRNEGQFCPASVAHAASHTSADVATRISLLLGAREHQRVARPVERHRNHFIVLDAEGDGRARLIEDAECHRISREERQLLSA